MSKFQSSSGQSIPMGILVKAAKKAENAERPAPKRKPENGERQVPWLWIAVGGSAGWVAIILVVALLTRGQENSQQNDVQNMPLPKAVDGPLAAVAPIPLIERPAEVNLDREVVNDALPIAPKLAPRQIKPDDAPPPIDIAPEEIKPQPPVVVPQEAPVTQKPVRRDVDLKVFANCQQIGTDILFMKDPPAAFKRARDEKKMVFMVHLSGNLEDPGFT